MNHQFPTMPILIFIPFLLCINDLHHRCKRTDFENSLISPLINLSEPILILSNIKYIIPSWLSRRWNVSERQRYVVVKWDLGNWERAKLWSFVKGDGSFLFHCEWKFITSGGGIVPIFKKSGRERKGGKGYIKLGRKFKTLLTFSNCC